MIYVRDVEDAAAYGGVSIVPLPCDAVFLSNLILDGLKQPCGIEFHAFVIGVQFQICKVFGFVGDELPCVHHGQVGVFLGFFGNAVTDILQNAKVVFTSFSSSRHRGSKINTGTEANSSLTAFKKAGIL